MRKIHVCGQTAFQNQNSLFWVLQLLEKLSEVVFQYFGLDLKNMWRQGPDRLDQDGVKCAENRASTYDLWSMIFWPWPSLCVQCGIFEKVLIAPKEITRMVHMTYPGHFCTCLQCNLQAWRALPLYHCMLPPITVTGSFTPSLPREGLTFSSAHLGCVGRRWRNTCAAASLGARMLNWAGSLLIFWLLSRGGL